MIAKGKRRKDILDNNNYISKKGLVTFVCPKCGNLYSNSVALDVYLRFMCPCETENYSITTPEIKKKCNCGEYAMQVDNAIGIIVKILIDKGYTVLNCCEGHAYSENGVMYYDFPYFYIDGNIKPYIPALYFDKLIISEDFDKTIITCGNVIMNNSMCITRACDFCIEDYDKYNIYKGNMINTIESLVKSLPVINNEKYNIDINNCCCYDYK